MITHISRQNRQLFKVAGSINLLLFLLSIAFVLFFGYDHGEPESIVRKIIIFVFANSICWLVNLSLHIVFVPWILKWKNSRWLSFYLPSYLVTFVLAILIANFVFYRWLNPVEQTIIRPLSYVAGINTLSLVAIELVLSRYAQAKIWAENNKMKMENTELKMKSLEAQHEKLKNQLNPHFLFNSLTALKSLIRRDPELAENYLVKLSEFLRFSMSHNKQNIVPLQEELKFSLYYLEMQKIRFRDALVYTVDIPDSQHVNASLPVFSLQLTLENAIKHNKLTREEPLCIVIRYLASGWLQVENTINEKLNSDPGTGIGLKNLSDRYKLLGEEDIRIDNDAQFFKVDFKIIRQ